MPVPIRINNHDHKNDDEKSPIMDFSVLLSGIPNDKPMKKIAASDKDAKLLFEIWSASQKINETTYKVSSSSSVSSRDLIRLKTLGLIQGDKDTVSFTDRGKVVVSTMALGEPNKFEEKRQDKSYSEILASMDKRKKKGYRIAAAPTVEIDREPAEPTPEKNREVKFTTDSMLNTFIGNDNNKE